MEAGATQAEGSAEQLAAEAALARAENPPEALGGEPQPAADLPGAIGRSSDMAAKLAEHRADGEDVIVADEYHDARNRVSNGQGDEEDLAKVTEWLLSDDAEVNTRMLKVRLGGSDDDPLVAPWYIRAIGIDVIRSAEREAAGNRAQRRSGGSGYDELAANLRIVVEGTAAVGAADGPDLKQLAKQKGLGDATILVERRFRFRPGAIAQIAGEVMALSGFDAEDVRAAGN